MSFCIYRDRNKQWRWTLYASNGRKLANTGEGYKTRAHCLKMIHRIILMGNPKIVYK